MDKLYRLFNFFRHKVDSIMATCITSLFSSRSAKECRYWAALTSISFKPKETIIFTFKDENVNIF